MKTDTVEKRKIAIICISDRDFESYKKLLGPEENEEYIKVLCEYHVVGRVFDWMKESHGCGFRVKLRDELMDAVYLRMTKEGRKEWDEKKLREKKLHPWSKVRKSRAGGGGVGGGVRSGDANCGGGGERKRPIPNSWVGAREKRNYGKK